MKQQSPAKKPSVVSKEWPEHPNLPQLKTIGGQADASAIARHNDELGNWYYKVREKYQQEIQEIMSRLDNLEAEVKALQKQAASVT